MKRAPSTTAASMLAAAVNATRPEIQPPAFVKLEDRHLKFWSGIIRARARAEWIDVDLVVAGQLARCQADIEVQQDALDTEGAILTNARGTQIMNPRVTILEQLSRRQMALMRALRMGGRVAGDSRDQEGTRKAEESARRAAEEVEEDDLLA